MTDPISALQIIEGVTDEGSFLPGAQPETRSDPLDWNLTGSYMDSLALLKRKTGLQSALLWGQGTIGGTRAVLISAELGFMAGSLGLAEAEAIRCALEMAVREHLPVVWFAGGGGCRMQEGPISLFCISSVVAARKALAEQHFPLLAVIANPVYGGTAICALRADIILGVHGTHLGFAGRHVVETMEKPPLPVGFPSEATSAIGAWEIVQAARTVRPTTRDLVAKLGDGFFELHGDRVSGDDHAILGGITRIEGVPVMVVGHDTARGQDTVFKITHNFNMAEASGHRKALRLVRLADRLRIPILTLIDTPGASVSVRSESEGQAQIVGELLEAILGVAVPTVAVILGEGGSGGAVSFASTDRLLMTEVSYCSVLSPEGAAAIFLRDIGKSPQAAEALRLTPNDLKQLGLVDKVLPIKDGDQEFVSILRKTFLACLDEMGAQPDKARRMRLPV